MKEQRKGLATPALVGAVVVVAIAVGAIAYYIGQSGGSTESAPSVMTTTSITTVTMAGTGTVSTVTSTSGGGGVATTMTITSSATSTIITTTTKTSSVVSTSIIPCPAGVQGCVVDYDNDGA